MPIEDYRAAANTISEFLKLLVATEIGRAHV